MLQGQAANRYWHWERLKQNTSNPETRQKSQAYRYKDDTRFDNDKLSISKTSPAHQKPIPLALFNIGVILPRISLHKQPWKERTADRIEMDRDYGSRARTARNQYKWCMFSSQIARRVRSWLAYHLPPRRRSDARHPNFLVRLVPPMTELSDQTRDVFHCSIVRVTDQHARLRWYRYH
jgi:hypothetical protein